MTNSFFIPSDTKPGKSKISSLLKSLGFIERTSTPLWSYTYTRLRVDQVDFRDDFYEDAEWLYDTDFETKWGLRISLHATHKPEHRSLYQSLTLIIAQIFESDILYVNANQQDVPGAEIEPNDVLNWDSVITATSARPPKEDDNQDESFEEQDGDSQSLSWNEVKSKSLPGRVDGDNDYLPETPPSPQLVQVTVEDDDDDDDDDDEWDDDGWDDDEEEEEEEYPPQEEDEEEDLWGSEEQEDDSSDDEEQGDFDGIVTWD